MSSSLLSLLPDAAEIDFGATPSRTNKTITIKCRSVENQVTEQDIGGNTIKFKQRIYIDIYAREIKARGLRSGREPPPSLVAIEKWLTDFIAVNRLSLQEVMGVQYMEIVSSETFSEIEGPSEERGSLWYHTVIQLALHYWMKP